MGFRSPPAGLVALALVPAVLVLLVARPAVAGAAAADPTAPGAWTRPVGGAVARSFVAPQSRYGAGHRGVDFVAAAGTPVVAANAGVVSFAGDVAGSLHVVVAHPGDLRTSVSFLASVTVRRGERVSRGQVIGTAGAGDGEHAGVLHFGLRVGDRYVDPMLLFTPADLTRLIRLVPVDAPARAGFEPPALERRALAESLHLPRGVTDLAADLDAARTGDADRGPLDLIGDALTDVGAVARALRGPSNGPAALLGAAAGWLWRGSLAAPMLADARAVADRLLAWARSRGDCVDDPAPAASGGGSGHRALTIAGINSATDPETGTALALDTDRLGYRAGEVQSFSYAADGGPYRREDTAGNLGRAARQLGDQLRAMQREQPGREVDLIAHSQGGVVAVEFLTHRFDSGDATLPPIGTVVTLSSPLQGAPAATAVAKARQSATGRAALDAVERAAGGSLPPTSGTSTRQLAEQAPLIRGITDTPLPEGIDLTSIGATDDVIVPADHAARPGARTVTVDPSGLSDHSGIVTDGAALDATRLALEGRPPACVGVVAGVRAAVEPVVISRAEHVAGEAAGLVGHLSDAALGAGGSR